MSRRLVKKDGELFWNIEYYGLISHDPLPTEEDFKKDIELLKEDIEQLSPPR